MGKLIVKIVYEEVFGAYSENVSGCVAVGGTLEDVKDNFAKSLDLHICGMVEDGEALPEVLQGVVEFDYIINIQAILKHYRSIISFSALEKATGINQRQLSHYASGHRNPRPKQREKIVEGLHKLGGELISVQSY